MTGTPTGGGIAVGPEDRSPQRESVLAALLAEFESRWPAGATGLAGMHRYAITPPGKLVRPQLVVWSALAVGGELARALPVALGFEAVHTGSLLHDDLIDRDDVRRARPAVHAAFGAAQAIIAGNALFFEWFVALDRAARHGAPAEVIVAVLREQAAAGAAVCHGALAELELSGAPDQPVEAYLAMARAKTAVLTRAACVVGALLGGAGAAETASLADFGEFYGMAFQIRDDLLPYVPPGDPAGGGAGKPADSDLRNRRPALPLLLAWEHAGDDARARLRRAMDEDDPAAAAAQVRAVLDETGALRRARLLGDEYLLRARRALTALPAGCARTELAAMTHHIA
ncbi:polyprenyl synthetase family protein [Actinomadura sp. 21ATH]|uniref:polyprenyl synthetase family protein n=1 Tax=Actinomadura sp. 21ATH TaxID=1735444 RepID=UPI0035C1E71D